jgi:hypothetical protein
VTKSDDHARRTFLSPLLRAIQEEHGDALNFFFDEIDPSRGLGLSIAFEGEPGMAQVAAVRIADNVIQYADFGVSEGVPHYQLMIFGDGAERAHTNRTTCHANVVLEAIAAWRAMACPPQVSPLPLGDVDRRALAAIARARKVVGELVENVEARIVAAADRVRLSEDVTSISTAALFASFPRDDDGELALGETALLAKYATDKRLAKGRETWLVAKGPERKKDGNALVIEVATPITENEPHVWENARWLWDSRVGPMRSAEDQEERWGTKKDDVQANECLGLLDAGRFQEAFALYGVGLDEKVLRTLVAQAASVHDASFASRWCETLRRALWRVAPWRLAEAVASPRHARRRGEKEDWLRLFGFPGQRHQRKASLMLVAGDGARDLRFAIDWTGSNARLPLVRWTRALDHDLERLGLMT